MREGNIEASAQFLVKPYRKKELARRWKRCSAPRPWSVDHRRTPTSRGAPVGRLRSGFGRPSGGCFRCAAAVPTSRRRTVWLALAYLFLTGGLLAALLLQLRAEAVTASRKELGAFAQLAAGHTSNVLVGIEDSLKLTEVTLSLAGGNRRSRRRIDQRDVARCRGAARKACRTSSYSMQRGGSSTRPASQAHPISTTPTAPILIDSRTIPP